MIKGLAVAMAILNFVLLSYIYFPNEKTLAEVAAKNSGNDHEVFYEALGSFFSKKFRHVTGKDISVLYSKDGEVIYVYSKEGPILAYASNSIEVYPAGFNGNFHEVTPGMLYYDRDINVISYYNGQEIKIGEADVYPELILDATKNDSRYGLLYQLEANSGNEISHVFKDRRECDFMDSSFTYFVCCSTASNESDHKSTSVEGYVYLPFDLNKSRWQKIKEGFHLDQSLLDQSCEALHEHNESTDKILKSRAGANFMYLEAEGYQDRGGVN